MRLTVSQARRNGTRYARKTISVKARSTVNLRVTMPRAATRSIRSGRKLKVKVALATTSGSALGTATVTLTR